MKSTAGFRLGTAFAVAFALAVTAPAVAEAGIVGSAHDFSGLPITTQGPCSACHIPHRSSSTTAGAWIPALSTAGYTPQFRLWIRDLVNEASYFSQYSTAPNYLPPPTLYCYDCHENQADDVESSTDADSPPNSAWSATSIHIGQPGYPQDIALGDYGVSQSSGVNVGYYEKEDGSIPPPSGPTDGSPTGGHYWKRPDADISGLPAYSQGDKLDCGICHDIHNIDTGTNDVLFRARFWNGTDWQTHAQSTLTASTNTRAHATGDPVTYNGRSMCAACHSYSNTSGYTDAPTQPIEMWGTGTSAEVPRPPTAILQHDSDNTSACTCCHEHNKVSFKCDDCHGYPPTNTTAWDVDTNRSGESYAGGAGAHQRHMDALGPAFDCALCHGPGYGNKCEATWHNEGDGTVIATSVDIIGHGDYWDTGDVGGHTALYNGPGTSGENPSLVDNTIRWEPIKKGGGGQRCATLTCHGDPPDVAGALDWTDDMVDDTPPADPSGTFIDRLICVWCHDQTPSTIDGGTTYALNIMGTGGVPSTVTNFGAEVNGHGLAAGQYDATDVGTGGGLAAANKDCDLCHDATYIAGVPTRRHFGDGVDERDDKRLRDDLGGYTIDDADANGDLAPDDVCNACHRNSSSAPPYQGTAISHHGNTPPPPYTQLEPPDFRRNCRQCHDVHGRTWNGTARNIHMVGKWIDTDGDGQPDAGEGARVDSNASDQNADITAADNAVAFTSFTGANSFDEIDSGTPPDSAAQNADDICGTCHVHSTTAGAATNGGDHWGTLAFGGDMRETDCLQCHDHDYDDDWTTHDAFLPSGCEGCHGCPTYDPGGGDPPAPNVMGNGSDPVGQGGNPKLCDDGTFGFNVNGHGSNGTAPVPIGGYAPVIDLDCTACHNVGDPPGTHNDRTLDGRTPDPTNNNPFHLVSGFVNTSPTQEYDVQVDFDDYCATTCHTGKDMRHGKDNNPVANAVQFGQHHSYPFPSNTPPPNMFYDVNLTYLAPGGLGDSPHFGPCISCHDPHGTNVVSPRSDNVNFMVIYRWKNPSMLCAKCHP